MRTFQKIDNPNLLLWMWLGLWWLANLLQAGFTELANDEAYYHMFARDLAWGYFDHPPMTALLVKLGDFLGGELGVRFFFTLLQPLYLYLLWLVVKPERPERKDVSLFVLLAAAMPILQLYGFLAVPDGPLMFFTALLLYCYKKFTETNSWLTALALGAAVAGLAYSKYQGALVVVLLVLSNLRLLKNPKVYLAGLFALLLMLPHLIWQYQHDWVSFRYHLVTRNGSFHLGYVIEYLLNLLAIFNPFLFPLFILAWWKHRHDSEPVWKGLNWISAGFILFFLASTFRGYVQPQWDIPVTFGVIALLFAYGRQREKMRRYMVRVCQITLILMALVRIEMIFNPLGLKQEVFNNKKAYGQLAAVAGGNPIIFEGKYAIAAKYTFYTGGEAFAQPSAWRRSSQYELRSDDETWAGRRVILEVTDTVSDARYIRLANGKFFYYVVQDDFKPVRRIRIDYQPDLPDRLQTGQTFDLDMTLTNPYPYDITLDGKDTVVVMIWRFPGETTVALPLTRLTGTLESGGVFRDIVRISVPEELKHKRYLVGFTISNSPGTSWFNSRRQYITVEPVEL